MKKLIFSAVAMILAAGAIAQSNVDRERENFFRFGAKAGVNINKIGGMSYNEGFRYNFQAGGFLQFNFSDRFGLQPEVNFVQSESEFSNDPNNIYDGLFGGSSQRNAKLNYLEVPVLLNINVGESKRVKLQVGPSYGALLSETVDNINDSQELYEKGEFSAIGGLWIQLPFINIGARYKYGLSNINAVDGRESWHNQAFQIHAGITF